MPLLKKKVFQKAPLPQDLRRDEEVYHCVMTNEIFREYEEFCQRVILCNSMVWTCSLTGKSGLTYSEALESEQNAHNILKDFPTELRIPILFLASKTQRTSFSDMAEDVFMYVKDRYFIGENVEASFTGNKWRESHVLQVIAPTEEEIKSAPKNGQSTDRQFYPLASLYRYEVEQLDAEDEDVSEVMIVGCDHIKRKKSSFTRDKSKMFLKQFAEQNEHSVFVIKEAVLESYGIYKVKFDQIFDGPMPNFEASKKLMRSTQNGKRSKQETLTTFLSKNNGVSSAENTVNLLDKMKKRQEEFQQLKEALKQKKADEKLAEKQKRKEENFKISTILKDWYKPKEDLELEDHKKIPVPAPLHSKVPDKYMGDVLMIIEFVHSFSKLLYASDFFPGGLTLELMERALMQKEVAGPLTDVIQMFLTALFNVHAEEATQCRTEVDNNSIDIKGKDVNDNVSLTDATHFATVASNWSVTHQGLPLHKLPLYSLTTSEILRLHLLSSGARIKEMGAKWRYQHRGGYTSEDDPALYLRLKQPHILKALALHNITELPLGDKLKIMNCLINQLLTYADVRDAVEDRLEKSKQAKLDIRTAQIADRRKDQEYITAKFKIKKEGRDNNKDVTPELDKLSKEIERKKGQSDRKMEGLIKIATEHQIMLGQDRAFQKYVKLESIPGLFVNFEEDNPGFCLDEPVKQIPNLVGADRTETLAHVRKIYDEMNTSDKENNKHETDSQGKEPKKVNGIRNSLLSVNETDSEALLVCTAEPTKCIVHSTSRTRPKWSFYHTREQIEELADSLNKRGVRESELKQTIATEQDYLSTLVAQTPVTQLNPNVEVVETEQKLRPKRHGGGKSKYEDTNLGYPDEMNTGSVLQFALVDNILEMEEKIFAGNLGSTKVKDRDAWREHLTNRQFSELDKTLIKKEKEVSKAVDKVKKEGRNSRPNTPDPSKEYKDPGKFLGLTLEIDSEDSDIDSGELPLFQSEDHKLAVQTLAIALVQVGQGVENRYLKKPLGHAGMRNDAKKTEEHDVMSRWEQSLLAATSYSQIFLHFSTLDNCILWSRSALLARCHVCRRQNDSENMLLCDNCNKGHHLYCLKPKLTSVPQGDWFCKECQKQKDKEAKLNNPEPEPEPPQRKRRRIFKEEMSDEETPEVTENSIEEEEEQQEEEEHEQEPEEETSTLEEEEEEDAEMPETDSEEQNGVEEDSDKTEVCTKCGIGGTLLCCDNCPEMYHLECAEPPLRRVPRGEWFCYRCKIKKSREHSDSDSNGEAMSTRRSNRREAESRDDLPLHNAPLQELLSDVLKQDSAWPFLRPVQKTEVPDYYDIITKPMDFGTIKYKLNMGEYKCDADLMVDAVLVFENCNTYNNADDEVYKCGETLLKYFVNKCRELGLKFPEELLNNEDGDNINQPALKRMRTK